MATKAERFRYDAERAAGAKTKAKPKKKRPSASMRGPSRGRKAVFAFEETPKATPASRKSTRRSKNRQKAATALTSKNILTRTSPQSVHDRGGPTPRAAR
jgi:hypothetical protein